MQMKLNNFQKSFSLLEVMIAVFVLVLGILAVIQAFPISINVRGEAKRKTVAAHLAQGKIEEIQSYTYDNIEIGTTTEDYGSIAEFENYKRVTAVKYNYVEGSNLKKATSDQGLKKIEVTIYWEKPIKEGEDKFKIATLVSER